MLEMKKERFAWMMRKKRRQLKQFAQDSFALKTIRLFRLAKKFSKLDIPKTMWIITLKILQSAEAMP